MSKTEQDAEKWRKLEELVDIHNDNYWYVHPGAGEDRIKSAQQLNRCIEELL